MLKQKNLMFFQEKGVIPAAEGVGVDCPAPGIAVDPLHVNKYLMFAEKNMLRIILCMDSRASIFLIYLA